MRFRKFHLWFFVILFLTGCGGGGGGGGSSSGDKIDPGSLTLKLGTPSTYPTVIPPSGTPTLVNFLAVVSGNATPPTELHLDEINDTGVVTNTSVARLRDDGRIADQELGDRIYTGILSLGSVDAIEKHFRVRAQYNGDTIVSGIMNFWISGCPATSRPSDPLLIVNDPISNSFIYSNEVMIRTEAGVPPDLGRINNIAAQVSGRVVGCIPALRQYLLELDNENGADGVYNAIDTLVAHTDIAAAFPNGQTLDPAQSPVETSLLCNGVVDTQCQWYLDRVRAPQAWQLAGGGDPQKGVAIIDFGVDCSRGGLPCDSDLYNQDPIDHGTGVAGIIGSPDTPSGMVGVAWNTYIYPYSFLGNAGSQYKMNELITAAISQTDVRVINISAGTRADIDGQIKQAICTAIDSGRLVVAAAGNPMGSDAASCQLANVYPASYNDATEQCANGADLQTGLLVVGASDINNNLASWQNAGQAQCSNQLYVDVYAPGKDIITLSTQFGYTTKSGTSYAAPLASGAASVVWSANPQFTPSEVHDRIVSQASLLTLSNGNPRIQTGDNRMVNKPLLDIYRAVGGLDVVAVPDTTPDNYALAAQANAPLQTWIVSGPVTVSGIDSPSPINVTDGYYSINDAPFTNAAGSVRNGDQVRVQLYSAVTPATTLQAQLNIGGVSQTYQVTTRDPLITPGSSEFTMQENVVPNTPVLSNAQVITGIDAGTPISISGDNAEYSIDGGAFTSIAGTIDNNQSVQVRVTSSTTFATPAEATLTIGTVSSNFTVVTQTADTSPDTFLFSAMSNVQPNTTVTSNSISVSGINAPTVIGVSAGEYSIDSGPFTNAAGVINNGQSVQVRLTSHAGFGLTRSATLTIGGVSSIFSVTTATLDTTPDAFSFIAQNNIPVNTPVTSNTVIISGIDAAAPISISGSNAEYAIDGGAFTSTVGTISNGQSVQVRLTSAITLNTAVNTTLTIGGVSAVFSVATQGADTIPDNFNFTPQTNIDLNTQVLSNTISVTGINTATPISISGQTAEYAIDGGAFTSNPGTVNTGQSVQVRITSANQPETLTTATLTVGDVSSDFTVTTLPLDTTPNAFSFAPQTNIALNTQVTSNSIIVTGINSAASISITGATAQYSINSGTFTSTPSTIDNGQTVQIRLNSAANPGVTTTATLTIGGVSANFDVSTVPVDTAPDPFSFIAQSDVAVSTLAASNTVAISGINSPAPISISGAGAEYAIDGGAFTSSAGSITNGQSVQVRLTSAATPNTSIAATLTIGGVSADFTVTSIAQFQVTTNVSANGSISPTNATVNQDGTTSFTVTPNEGYSIDSVQGCGGSLLNNTYTTAAITADCTVTASFVANPSQTIGGNITGLVGNGLMLSISYSGTSQNLQINAPDNSFSFPTALLEGVNYTASIDAQPSQPSQSCNISSGATGTVSAVTSINISCGFNWVSVNPGQSANSLISPIWNGTQLVTIDRYRSAIVTGVLDQGSLVWSKYLPPGPLTAIIWNGSMWVTVGQYGAIVTSPDGVTWTVQNSGTNNHLSGVAWTGSLFVVVGDSGTILTSSDGINWIARVSGTSEFLRDVNWNGTQLLAVGMNGTVLTSNNAIDWTVQTSGNADDLSKIVWTGQRYIVGSYNSSTIRSSVDGIAWTDPAPSIGPVTDILWTGSLIVAVGWNGALTSPDGISWTSRSVGPQSLNGVTWNGSQFVIVAASGRVFTSPDAVTWTPITQPVTTNRLNGVIWANNLFYAVGDYGTVLSSADGLVWDRVSPTEHIRELVNDGTRWVAVGESGSILTSIDGATWTPRVSNTFNYLWSVVATINPSLPGIQFVAVGSFGTILTSADGITWETQNSNTTQSLWDVTWAGNFLVAVGEGGTIVTSTNGVTWVASQSGTTESLRTVGGNGSQWVAASNAGSILTGTPNISEPSGIEWIVNSTVSTGIFYDATWADGYWLVGAYPSGANTFISTDGINWNPVAQPAGGGYNYRFWRIGNQWLSVGISGDMITSVDGDNWIEVPALDAPFLYGNWINGLSWNGQELIAYGFGGSIFITQ